MKTRVMSSIAIGVILLVVLLCGGYVMAAVLLMLSLIAYFELMRATGVHQAEKKCSGIEMAGYIGIVFHYGLMLFMGKDIRFFGLSILFVFFAVMIVYVLTFPKYQAQQAMAAIFSFLYAPVMLSFVYLLRIGKYGEYIVWVPFVAWICDTCAYLAGRAFGKHKLCPRLSPQKTIEGAIGGVAGSVAAGAIFGVVLSGAATHNSDTIWMFMIITLIASVISQIGDLAASGIKRDHQIKDYGNLIPGHGGIMDRFDSVIFVTPMVYLLSVLFIK